jgi:hypothetical protein
MEVDQDTAVEISNVKGKVEMLRRDVDDLREDKKDTDTFKVEIRKFVDEFRGAEAQNQELQQSRHRANTIRLNVIMAFAGMGSMIIAAVGVMVAVYVSHH